MKANQKNIQNLQLIKMKIKPWLTEDRLEMIAGWARDGLNNSEIAEKMGVSRICFQKSLVKYEELRGAVEEGRFRADLKVENALFKRTQGYDVEEKEVDSSGYKKIRTRHIPADTTAQIFWLKKRKPAQWDADSQTNSEILEKVKEALKVALPGNIMKK